MDSITTQLKRHRLHSIVLNRSNAFYLFSTVLPVAATALIFFLPPYFVKVLQFSLLHAGLLIAFYGIGIVLAILFTPYFNTHYSRTKMIVFSLGANGIAIANFLYVKTFLPLSFNLILLGFAAYCFKNNHSHWVLQYTKNDAHTQTKTLQHTYMASSIGLGLAMAIIALFAINNFTALFISAMILNALPLFFLPRDILGGTRRSAPTLILEEAREPAPIPADIFSLTLLFLGGLILSQLTATYSIYLSLEFPRVGLTAMAVFMLVNVFLLSWLQKPVLNVFNCVNKPLYSSCGAILMGLGYYVGSLAHIFLLVVLSAMILSLGEIFFIGSLYSSCKQHFQSVLALSLIVGAGLGAYVYQFFGATILWQSCVSIGILCFGLVVAKAVIVNIFVIGRRIINKDALL